MLRCRVTWLDVGSRVRLVLQVGPSVRAAGGIASVIKTLCDSELSVHYRVRTVATSGFGTHLLGRLREVMGIAHALGIIVAKRPLVHVHVASGGSFVRKSFVLMGCRLLRVPTILHLHGGRFHEFAASSRLVARCVRFIFEGADVIAVLSPEWRERVRQFSGRCDAVVVPNPVRIPVNPAHGSRTLTYFGKLVEGKGVWVLLDAIERLQTQGIRFPAVLAGDGAIAAVRDHVATLPYPEDMKVPGWLSSEQVAAELAESAIFCLPSYDEGLPLALLEAMAHGVACVATPVGGIPSVMVHEETGLLVPTGDPEALAGAITRLLSNESLRDELGRAARAVVIREHAVDVTIQSLERLYGSLGVSPRDPGSAG